MTRETLEKYFPDIRQADTDHDRLQVADMVLALVEQELHALDSQDDDLTYLIEVLRCGVQRALGDGELATGLFLSAEPQGRTH